MKSVLAIAALAAALSTAAFAADVKSSAPIPMTDSQMDAVTAGAAANPGFGIGTAVGVNGGFAHLPDEICTTPGVCADGTHGALTQPPAGFGKCTAAGGPCP